MKSIRKKLISSYIWVIIFTVIICELFLISLIKKYFYNNTEQLLCNQIKLSADFYNNYLSSISLKENIANDVDIFWRNTSAEVQILDKSGHILMDSIGYIDKNIINYKDFNEALSGKLGTFTHTIPNSSETIMSVSIPLKKGENIEGILRFTTSLNKIDIEISSISFYIILVGFLVILISSAFSLIISKQMTKPIKEITNGAEKMASGKFNEKIIIHSDDEFEKLANTLNYMSEEILKNEKLKNEFIASVSHELRTPLTSIKGWSIALSLCDPRNIEEFKDGLKIIEEESDRLTSLVEELLDFSKLSSGKITLKKDYINLYELLKHIEKQLHPRATRENVALFLNYTEPAPKIYADPNRLKQLFVNILDNALKFTPSTGTINMTLSTNDTHVIIVIKDTGCGIPKNDLPRVTEKFFKGKNSKSTNGIGLSICAEIVSLHSGIMEISSEENKGTEIMIILPIKED